MVKYLKQGQDFSFPREFGFTQSAVGRHDPRNDTRPDDGEYGDGLAKGGKIKRMADGGQAYPPDSGRPQEPTVSMPLSTARDAAKGVFRLGQQHGAQTAVRALTQVQRGPGRMGAAQQPTVAPPQAPVQRQPMPALAQEAQPAALKKGGFIKSAIRHPGKETRRAKAAGRSVHQQMEVDSHSSDKSIRSAGALGLRLTGGDLKPGRKRK